jgi:hypothetical protein
MPAPVDIESIVQQIVALHWNHAPTSVDAREPGKRVGIVIAHSREGFYEKLWKDFVSIQRGDMQGVLARVERYYREHE